MQKWLLPLGAILLLVPNFLNVDINHQQEAKRAELFDASLSRLSTIEKLAAYADSIASSQNISSTQPEYLLLIEKITAARFYHGFSHYSLKENWIAAVSEKIFGRGLSCIVKPEDLMKKSEAACSQQSIVVIELLKRKNIDYRKIGLIHHFALEAKVDNQWYFVDASLEPAIPLFARLHENWKGQPDNLKTYYDRKVYPNLDFAFGVSQVAEIGPVNEVPARRLSYFHSFTLLSSCFSCFLPIIFLYVKSKKRKRAKVIPIHQQATRQQMQHRFYIS